MICAGLGVLAGGSKSIFKLSLALVFLQIDSPKASAGRVAVRASRSDDLLASCPQNFLERSCTFGFGIPSRPQSLADHSAVDLGRTLCGSHRRHGNRAGIVLEHNLVRRLRQDAGKPDSLPLLEFAIWRLYDLHFEGPHADRGARLALQAPASK